MPCERCGGPMDTYELEGRDAASCRECGYVDVPVEHEPDGRETESWEEAISRFRGTDADATGSGEGLPEEASATDD